MKNITFNKINQERKSFLSLNESLDHKILIGQNNVLLSAPHGVSQVRLGKHKYQEKGSLATALYLQKVTNSFLIAKTKNNNDDANFDENCEYKNAIKKLIVKNNIKFIIDFHGLSSKRKMDINLGTHIGKNVENNLDKFNSLYNDLKQNNFIVTIDQPFMATRNTISSSMKRQFHQLFTIQIEINCAITNNIKNFRKYQSLLTILTQWINSLK